MKPWSRLLRFDSIILLRVIYCEVLDATGTQTTSSLASASNSATYSPARIEQGRKSRPKIWFFPTQMYKASASRATSSPWWRVSVTHLGTLFFSAKQTFSLLGPLSVRIWWWHFDWLPWLSVRTKCTHIAPLLPYPPDCPKTKEKSQWWQSQPTRLVRAATTWQWC
jgi:hypothetical protein